MKKLTFAALLIMLVLVMAACGGGGETPPTGGGDATGARDVTVEGLVTLKWEPAAITAAAGETLNITMTSDGALEHNFVWEDDVDTDFLHVDIGETTDGPASRTFDTAGTYNFYCTVPGHREAGMVGAVTVN